MFFTFCISTLYAPVYPLCIVDARAAWAFICDTVYGGLKMRDMCACARIDWEVWKKKRFLIPFESYFLRWCALLVHKQQNGWDDKSNIIVHDTCHSNHFYLHKKYSFIICFSAAAYFRIDRLWSGCDFEKRANKISSVCFYGVEILGTIILHTCLFIFVAAAEFFCFCISV